MQINRANLISITPLILSMVIFLGFGLHHLTQFETTDEHFWKYDRIQKYYNGIRDGVTENDWKKTRINDKPGVSVALLSGMGLPFAPDPQEHRDHAMEEATRFVDENGKSVKLYDIFHTEQTSQLNRALRLPILLFNALIILPLIYYGMRRATSARIANTSILLIGLNSILIGISQIINPDALLWSTAAVGIVSFYALLTTRERKFAILCGLATGAALLSKYTANLLFIFYPLTFILHAFFSTQTMTARQYMRSMILIIALAWILFALLMPAVIQKPAHFLYGTTYSPVLSAIVDPFITVTDTFDLFFVADGNYRTVPLFLLSASIFFAGVLIAPVIIIYMLRKWPILCKVGCKILPVIFILITVITLYNAWTNASLFDLSNIKEASQDREELSFPQLARYSGPLHFFFALCIQLHNIIFSLHPIVLIAFLSGCIYVLYIKNSAAMHALIHFPIIAIFIFALGGMFSDIFVNVRYAIMLYVPIAVASAIMIERFAEQIATRFSCKKWNVHVAVLVIIAVTHVISLVTTAPYYFNYENLLLPKKYTVTDSWGYGVYEAATYLNTLPNAHDIIVWSDRDGLCQFFVGKCISPTVIDLDHTNVDYLVLTRRGMIRKPFSTRSSNGATLDRNYYYSDAVLGAPAWELHINDRPHNFIKVIQVNP